ncbi:Glycosyltransferase involved in cell wall bisynthesis [Abditibacterium utsteinense]|uniref:Glycosyltransferase involved in cell wall bisynthesis n=1 Tax=Abditibacterium utsteinense TaxID=1960156 RepID=A0A2S8SX82_9BACT|nr:glycosyltransferase family 4 protein [Abditibacterium utsteinense]PQV65378.1 Glycosyltransferase involved in cell wall bisynthesis [Abditibacterium utsteinense]
MCPTQATQPMTILQYITPSRLGGAERYFLKLVEELSLRGHRVIVVTKRDTPLRAELETLSAEMPESARPELHFWHTHGKIDPLTLWKLVRLVKSRGVQVINTHLTTASWQGSLAGKITKVPVAAVVHATDRKTFFQWADRLIAVSGGVANFLCEQGVPPQKIERLYCGLDLRDVAAVDSVSPQEAKAALGLPSDALTVGMAASLIGRKGHRFLLDAIQTLVKRGLDVHAVFAGEGDQETALRAQVANLGLENRVHFLGFRRDVHRVISAMDVFTLPSEKEGLSIAVMEAMAIGRPVVATLIPGMNEVVKDGENGFLVPPCDALALADALETLLRDPDLRAQLGANGKTFVKNHFDQEQCITQVEAFFESMVADALNSTLSQPESIPGEEPAMAATPLRLMQIIAPSKVSGAEYLTVDLCRRLAARGHSVELLVKANHALIEVARAAGVSTSSERFSGKLNLLAMRRLRRRMREFRVDLVATQLSTASLWGSLAARAIGVPCVATVHALNTKTCYVFADRIIVVSHAVKAHLAAQGIAPRKMRVVYNGIDLSRFQRSLDENEIRAAKLELGFEADAPLIGVVAHLTRKKGHRWFLEAAAGLVQISPRAQFVFVGDGPERAALQAQVESLGLGANVRFAGYQKEVVPWIAALDVLVLPTIQKEGFGRVLVEAGAMGKPVVSTPIGGISEVVVDGETGLIVPAFDSKSLLEALSGLLSDPARRAAMGMAGRARAVNHFSIERMVSETEKVYRELLAERALSKMKRVAPALLRSLYSRGANARNSRGI